MSFKWIDHVVIAVKDMDQAVSTYRDKLGLKLRGINNAPELGIKQAHFDLGDGRFIELAEPLGPETAVGRSIERRGEGIHILAVAVENMEKAKIPWEAGKPVTAMLQNRKQDSAETTWNQINSFETGVN